jgi:23S rRNA pseudouridine1911/1915/1917 synthase
VPRRPRPPAIIYLDEHFAAVEKPARLLALPGRTAEPSVPDRLPGPLAREAAAWSAPHRLDSEASGIQLYARTPAAERALLALFEQQAIERTYAALVLGYVVSEGEVALQLNFNKKLERLEATPFRGKPAVTTYQIVQRVAGHTLLACRPRPDWACQLRAHLLAVGHPLAVDPLYGDGAALLLSRFKPDYRPSQRRTERPLLDRLGLHAGEVAFTHPFTGVPVRLTAPLPKDFRATLTQLGRLTG